MLKMAPSIVIKVTLLSCLAIVILKACHTSQFLVGLSEK